MIALAHASLTYDDGPDTLTAVDRVDLTVRPGEIAGLTGPSGSGKSSVLALASTLATPTSGRVVVAGVDTTDLTQAEKARVRRERVGLVFQQPQLIPALTAAEQLRVMGRLGGPASAVGTRVEELLELVGMAAHAHKRPHQLSGGQQQRVNIARALVNRPAALIVDEPTSALDRQRGAEILDLLIRLTRDQGTATLMVTHDRTHLPLLDTVHTLVDGRLVEGTD